MKDRIIFWVNFSRIFIKGVMNILYLGIVCLLIYLTYAFGWPCLKEVGGFFVWLFTGIASFDFVAFLGQICYWVFRIGIGGAIFAALFFLLAKSKIPFGRIFSTVGVPFVAFGEAACSFGSYIAKCFDGMCDFVAVFYEENCPKITIVDEHDAAIAAHEENE